jgi:hypothetical protein
MNTADPRLPVVQRNRYQTTCKAEEWNLKHVNNEVWHPKGTECPLRVRKDAIEILLNRDELKNVSTEELIYRAEVRLGLARLGPIRGIRVKERAMAIAVLVGMPDRTEP